MYNPSNVLNFELQQEIQRRTILMQEFEKYGKHGNLNRAVLIKEIWRGLEALSSPSIMEKRTELAILRRCRPY